MKLLLTGLMLVYAAHLGAQIPDRKIERTQDQVFTISYVFTNDSLKGFYTIAESFTGKAELMSSTCKCPFKFKNNVLQVSGEKITAGFNPVFTFKMLDDEISITGKFSAENFGSASIEKTFDEIKITRPPQAVAVNPAPPVKPEASGKTSSSQSSTINDQTSTINNQTPVLSEAKGSTIVFRVQLAASATPMDVDRIKRMTGLDLPVNEDHTGGLYRYTIGDEKTLAQAQAILNRTPVDRFKKPFIVAYRQQTRISVQQAMAEINKTN